MPASDPRRRLPALERLLVLPEVVRLLSLYGRERVAIQLRDALAGLRERLAGGELAGPGELEAAVAALPGAAATALAAELGAPLRRVLNASGVLLHTNLGRAPLPRSVAAALPGLLDAGCDLELDLASGRRGDRNARAGALLAALTGAEAGLVVNNNAAALVLVLATFAAGREVIVSRGELVEIGGGFRVPDVMAQSGAVLREVGTTNKTRVDDYRAAITDRTALILRVHRSNFRIEGFTEQPSLAALASLGRERGIPVIEDLGSGCIGIPGEEGDEALDVRLGGEPRVQASLAAGIDLVCFSGDKLLGGPQAGIVVGRRPLVDRVRRHPLMRALRVDKLTYAALEATLGEYVAGRAGRTVPLLAMLRAEEGAVGARAERLAESLVPARRPPGTAIEVIDGQSAIGGGTTPGLGIATRLLAIGLPQGPDWLDERLRRHDPPVIARIERDRLLLDLRSVNPEDDAVVLAALNAALGSALP